jgi:hypothetical protein
MFHGMNWRAQIIVFIGIALLAGPSRGDEREAIVKGVETIASPGLPGAILCVLGNTGERCGAQVDRRTSSVDARGDEVGYGKAMIAS